VTVVAETERYNRRSPQGLKGRQTRSILTKQSVESDC
jgi:hypothetical protein